MHVQPFEEAAFLAFSQRESGMSRQAASRKQAQELSIAVRCVTLVGECLAWLCIQHCMPWVLATVNHAHGLAWPACAHMLWRCALGSIRIVGRAGPSLRIALQVCWPLLLGRHIPTCCCDWCTGSFGQRLKHPGLWLCTACTSS